MEQARARVYRFGAFELDVRAGELRKGGLKVRLQEQPLRILVMLLEHPGEVVLREEIRQRLWPNNTIVEFDHGINAAIKRLRDALGESADSPRYVETLERRGYRFIGQVEADEKDPGDLADRHSVPGSNGLAGATISHYRVIEKIGSGGMGVVYKAQDVKLGREVALKLLSEELTADPDALKRFEREARAASALNHPNICTIYGVEEHEGQPIIAMELVEGDTLAERIRLGRLPLDQVLGLARQMAEALEAAHENGIVHRDFKPDNVKIKSDGRVKVLDFGLAKLLDASVSAKGTDNSPTVTSTRIGMVLGTASYMSPEQARGEAVDKRTDIWAFGVVLYEMVTGERPFGGATVSDALASVLKTEPDWNLLPAETPASIRRLIECCLTKDCRQRLQALGEARIEIEAAFAESVSGSVKIASFVKKHRSASIGSIAAVASLIVLTWFRLHGPAATSAELTQKRLTFNSNESPIHSQAISPDGNYLAYSDPTGIHLKLLSTSEDRLIPRPAGVAYGTYWQVDSWFPDGTQLLADVYQPGGQKSVWTVSMLGQSPRKLRDGAQGFEVSPDGTHVAFTQVGTPEYNRDVFREIWVMGGQGDNPQKILAAGANEWLQSVHWSPDGQRLAFIRVNRGSDPLQHSIETYNLNGTSRTVVVPAGAALTDFCWLPEGRIVYARQDSPDSDAINLWQIRVDNHAGKPAAKPKRITSWAGSDLWSLTASADGKRLAILKRIDQVQAYVAELMADGTRMKLPQLLKNDEGYINPTAWMADSKAVLFHSNRNGTFGIFKQGISQEIAEPIFTGTQGAAGARLSADGAWILFFETAASANPAPRYRMMRIPAGGGVPQYVLETRRLDSLDMRCARSPANLCVIAETSQDGKQFVITSFDPLKGRGKVLRTIGRDPSHDYGGTLSVDGSTYAISAAGEPDIHIRLLSLSSGADREITVKGWPSGANLDWSADGKGFYCSSQSSHGSALLYVDLKGNAHVLWQNKGGGGPIWGMQSPDGRYLAIQATITNSNVWMVEGF